MTRLGRLALLSAAAALALAPGRDGGAFAATRLFIRNHVNSNDVRGVAAWNGGLAAATTGGVVTVAMPAGPAAKVLSGPGGLPTNQTLCVAESPSGSLWIGTAGAGIARLRTDGRFRRTLTSFDGLPSDQVQCLTRTGDSVWVGTNAGVALFTEDAATSQVSLRRSDSNASTAGALISDNVRAIAVLGDTVWCATDLGLAAFASGAWIDRRDVYAGAVNSLVVAADTLWIGAATGPRAYAGGVLAPLAPGHAGTSLALGRAGGVIYSATNGPGVFRFTGAAWVSSGTGLPFGSTQALGTAPDGSLWTGTQQGLARLDPAAGAWSVLRTDGPIVDDFRSATTGATGAWFATGNTLGTGTGGLAQRYDGVAWSAITTTNTGGALQAAATFAVLLDRGGRLWLGHCCGDVPPEPRAERYDPDSETWVYPGPKNIWAYAQDAAGRVYGASDKNGVGVSIFDGTTAALLDSLTPQNTQGSAQGAGLTINDLRGIAFDASGRAWIALAQTGVDRWDGKGTDVHSDDAWAHFATGFPSQQTTSIAAVGPAVYVGTQSGVMVLRNDVADLARRDAINAATGGAAVRAVAADPRGVVWLATASGLARVDDAAPAVERFTTADGLVNDDVQAVAWDESRGILWAATTHGVSEIHPFTEGAPSFASDAYVYPNPLGPASGPLRIGGLKGPVSGEIRDLTGRRVRNFHADPVSNAVWDTMSADGTPAAPGVYLVLLRDGDRSRILRAAVIR
ncbi:MAG TPA: hypothetical protein VF363_09875 [Candidatus Eisenbacteria bacterium]